VTSIRSLYSMVATLAILGSACSSSNSSSSGTGGTLGTGGTSSQAATDGGQSGSGGTNGTGEAPGSGGSTQPGTDGAGQGGLPGSGGAGVGGAPTDTGGATPAGSGGSEAVDGATSAGSGGAGGGGDVSPNAGCGKTRTLQNGPIDIPFNGASRKYILRVPSDYDNTHPYRLVFAFAESGSSAQSVADRNYFTMATQDSTNTIFVAPDAANSAGAWSKSDVDLTDAILAQIEGDLCIDTTRVFATGFSFGGAMSIAIACTRADVFRAVAFFSGADLTGSCPATLTTPIAYWASQASQDANGMDRTNPMTGEAKQAQFAAINGCTADPNSTNFPAAGQPHTCTIYQGCSAGHPTAYCVFNGGHGWEPKDPGQSSSWAPVEAWKFITQF
jgi:poly(3-hydroxybutyrate) depolymerase